MINQGERGTNSFLEEKDLLAKHIFTPTTLSLVEANREDVINNMHVENPPSPKLLSELRLSLDTIIEEWNNEVECDDDDDKVRIYHLQTK